MKIKPSFYKEFICIADQCTFTCCQEWKIAVDDDTYEKWKSIPCPDGEEQKMLCECTTIKDGGRVIQLNEKKRCPFLREDELCKLVLQHGDEVLSETCAMFPREIHDFEDRKEYALMPCCPAVIDFLKDKDFELVIDNLSEDWQEGNLLFQIRQFFMDLMEDKTRKPEEAFLMIFYLALELLEREDEDNLQDTIVRDFIEDGTISQLETAIKKMETDVVDTFYESSELFLDLVENYRKEGLYEKHLAQIAIIAEKNLCGEFFAEDEIEAVWQDFENVWQQYQSLWRNFLLEEIYADSLMPQGDLQSMVMKLQWIAMEYVIIRQMVFLKWQQNGAVSFEEIRDCIVVACRMMGYDEEDVEEYLLNSFEELIWEWGYLALIVGK